MTLRELLIARQAAVCGTWLDAILGEYGEVTRTRWRRERDPFANPVGHALTSGLPKLLEAVANEGEPGARALAALEAIVRIRSVQNFSPSRAVAFVYLLREAIREELAAELAGGGHRADLEAVDQRIERLALQAFDTYVRIREQLYRLRQEELKRSVATLLRRWHGEPADIAGAGGEAAPAGSPLPAGQPRPVPAVLDASDLVQLSPLPGHVVPR